MKERKDILPERQKKNSDWVDKGMVDTLFTGKDAKLFKRAQYIRGIGKLNDEIYGVGNHPGEIGGSEANTIVEINNYIDTFLRDTMDDYWDDPDVQEYREQTDRFVKNALKNVENMSYRYFTDQALTYIKNIGKKWS